MWSHVHWIWTSGCITEAQNLLCTLTLPTVEAIWSTRITLTSPVGGTQLRAINQYRVTKVGGVQVWKPFIGDENTSRVNTFC